MKALFYLIVALTLGAFGYLLWIAIEVEPFTHLH